MGMIFEGRASDSPYVETVLRVRADSDCAPVCNADGRWNILLTMKNGRVRVSVEGPLSKAKPKNHVEGTEWLVIKFKLGSWLPYIPVRDFLDNEAVLPEAASKSFWLNGSAWQVPDYENADTFVDRLVRSEVLRWDPVVNAVLNDQPQWISPRALRHRFLRVTGLSQNHIRQIERANYAAALLAQGVPILDAVDQAGYADQPHLTRSLRRFTGQTPAKLVQAQSERALAVMAS